MSSIPPVSHAPPVAQAAAPRPVDSKTPAATPDHDGDTDTGSVKVSSAKPPGVGTTVDVQA